jgi:hypothetical protein
MRKGCGKPGCPNDHRSQVLARGDEIINKSGDFRLWGTFQTCRRALKMSVWPFLHSGLHKKE